MKRSFRLSNKIGFAAILGVFAFEAQAIVNNGGFEAGFAGWTVADQLGSEGTFYLQTGTASPINGETVPAPPEGLTAAMTDAQGGGAHVLYQDFTVGSAVGPTALQFELFIGNRADDFYVPGPPPTLDWGTPELNQQVRVDLMLASADPFSVDPGDILMNFVQTVPGDPLVSGYTHHSFDITSLLNAHLNTALRLRFAETDNVFIFQLGVDNVSIAAVTTPVPDSLPTAATLLLAFGGLYLLRHPIRSPARQPER